MVVHSCLMICEMSLVMWISCRVLRWHLFHNQTSTSTSNSPHTICWLPLELSVWGKAVRSNVRTPKYECDVESVIYRRYDHVLKQIEAYQRFPRHKFEIEIGQARTLFRATIQFWWKCTVQEIVFKNIRRTFYTLWNFIRYVSIFAKTRRCIPFFGHRPISLQHTEDNSCL